MTTTDLDRLAELEAAANNGLWRSELQPGQTEKHTYSHQVASDMVPSGIIHTQKKADADLVAALRNAALDLIAGCRERDKLKAQVAALREALRDVFENCECLGPGAQLCGPCRCAAKLLEDTDA